jgi:hypothetical protein
VQRGCCDAGDERRERRRHRITPAFSLPRTRVSSLPPLNVEEWPVLEVPHEKVPTPQDGSDPTSSARAASRRNKAELQARFAEADARE